LTDFYSKDLDVVKVPDKIEEKFCITSKRLVLNGYCEVCQKQTQKQKGDSQ